MIWIVLYCVPGIALTLYAPIQRARLVKHIAETKLDPKRVEAMTEKEKATFALTMRAAHAPLSASQLVINGALWPLQVLIGVTAHVWIFFFRRRLNKALIKRSETPK